MLLRPSPLLREIMIGAIGRAQRLLGMRIHGAVALSNHYHALVSPLSAAQLAAFMSRVNSKMAKEAEHLHDWPQKVWSRRYEPIVVTQEERAQVARLTYLLAHGAKEGLVADPREWPGMHCAKALLDGEPLRGIWFDRSKEYAARRSGTPRSSYDFASVETVTLSPLPCWADLPREVIRLRVNEILTTIVSTPKPPPQPASGAGTQPNQSRLLHPHFRPPRTKRSPAPLVHAASDEARQQFLEAYRLFLAGSHETDGTSL